MTVIDFTQLLRDAKRQAKSSEKNKSMTVQDDEYEHEQPENNHLVAPRPLHTSASSTPPSPTWKDQYNSSLELEKLDLQKVCSNPKSIFYSPACLADSRPLADWLSALPQGDSGLEEWKTMTYGKRKVCMLGERRPLSPPLSVIAQQLVKKGIFSSDQPPNHVLLNEYQPSQGILPHTDGPLYASRTATLSLGSDVVLEFSKRLATHEIGGSSSTTATTRKDDAYSNNNITDDDNENKVSIVLRADSLIVFEEDAYLQYCHGIAMDVWEDTTGTNCLNAPAGVVVPRGRRFSLTFRHRFV
jgi:hypothetical protein